MQNKEIERLYQKGGDVIVLSSEDFTGRTLFKYRASSLDKKEILKLFKTVIDKYGLPIMVKLNDQGDLDWLKEDEKFKW